VSSRPALVSQEQAADELAPYLGARLSHASFSAIERSIASTRVKQFSADDLVALSRAFRVPLGWWFIPPDEAPCTPRTTTITASISPSSSTWSSGLNSVKSPLPRPGYRTWGAVTYDLGVDPAPETREQESYRDRVTRLADEQGVRPLVDPAELKADIWESDAELDEFLADVRRSRNANLA